MTVLHLEACPLAFYDHNNVTSRTDVFLIGNLIYIMLNTEQSRLCGPHCVPLAVFATSRPHPGADKPIPIRYLLGDEKLNAKGTHTEVQDVLGQVIDMQRLIISLPKNNFQPWSYNLQLTLSTSSTTFGYLETTVGCLNHTALVILLCRHFLG